MTMAGAIQQTSGHHEASLPPYYAHLAPFREVFQQRRAALMYHMLGPRPAGVRLKGLYMSRRLFDRQLRELRENGFVAGGPADLPRDGDDGPPRIVITFDDGCANVLSYGLDPLAHRGFFATQFLVADLIGKTNEWQQAEGDARQALMSREQVGEWLTAGHRIGAHTLTHPHLTQIGVARAREEISASKKKLEDMFGVSVPHFCYPYGDWNRAVRDLVEAAGYKTACTVEPGVNDPATDPFALKRITARYQSLRWNTLIPWLRSKLVSLQHKDTDRRNPTSGDPDRNLHPLRLFG